MFARALWTIVWTLFYRPTPRPLHSWRRMLLRAFGAQIEADAHPYPGARIWAPWNLEMKRGSCLADGVECYSVDRIVLGEGAVVSQYAFLCTGTHDYTKADFPLVTAPIVIGDQSWVAAGAFVGPGVRIGEGAVVGARSVVTRDVAAWTVVVGNPAKMVNMRVVRTQVG